MYSLVTILCLVINDIEDFGELFGNILLIWRRLSKEHVFRAADINIFKTNQKPSLLKTGLTIRAAGCDDNQWVE